MIKMKEWFRVNKWHELYQQYHVQKMSGCCKVVGETEKAFKVEVECVCMNNIKNFTIWVPKSCVEA